MCTRARRDASSNATSHGPLPRVLLVPARSAYRPNSAALADCTVGSTRGGMSSAAVVLWIGVEATERRPRGVRALDGCRRDELSGVRALDRSRGDDAGAFRGVRALHGRRRARHQRAELSGVRALRRTQRRWALPPRRRSCSARPPARDHGLLDCVHRAHRRCGRREPLLSGVRRDHVSGARGGRVRRRPPDGNRGDEHDCGGRGGTDRRQVARWSYFLGMETGQVVDTGSMDAGVEVSVCMGISFS